MLIDHKAYYHQMLEKRRLFPVFQNGKMKAFITFFITDDVQPYVEADPWDVLSDLPNGKYCYVAQLVTDKEKINSVRSHKVLSEFKDYIHQMFGSVEVFYWRRWNKHNGQVRTFKKELSYGTTIPSTCA